MCCESMDGEKKTYTEAEASAILSRAVERQELKGPVTHADLVATAQELNIEPATLDLTIAEQKRQSFALELRAQTRNSLRPVLIGLPVSAAVGAGVGILMHDSDVGIIIGSFAAVFFLFWTFARSMKSTLSRLFP